MQDITIWLLVAALIAIQLMILYVLFPGAVFALSMRAERALARLSVRAVALDDGVRIVYNEGGKGEPLLLLHGFTADKDNWTRIARHLTRRMHVIAPDIPGFGDSTQDPSLRYDIETQLARIERLLDRLGIDRYHVGGSSMGGNMAAHLAARHPERVLSVWLLAPGGIDAAEPSEMKRVLEAGKGHPLIPADRDGFEATLDFVFSSRPFIPGAVRRFLARDAVAREGLRHQIFDDILGEARTNIAPALDPVAGSIASPVLVVWGERDRVLHPSGAAVLGGLLPHGDIELMPGIGHLPMLEAPKETAQRYLGFLDGQQR